MSRRPRQTYHCHDLEELARQLLFVPAEKRAEQIRRAEQLHDQLDPQGNYPIDFLKFRITGHRSAEDEQVLLVGQAVLADLRTLIETLSSSLRMTLILEEQAESVQELADRLHVSTRTIARWRKLGLRVRWVWQAPASQSRLMVMRDAADTFAARHVDKVQRAADFSQMSSAQRDALVARARRLVLAGDVSLNQVAAHLARRTGRALETLRQMLQQYDLKHPDNPLFADRSGPLSPRQQEIIARGHRRGVSIHRMAQRFNKTRSTIYRAIRQRRAGELRTMEITFIMAPTYGRDDADQVILRPVRLTPVPCELNVQELPQVLAALYTQPGLSESAQQRLLTQFNYLKYKALTWRDGLDRYEPRVSEMDRITALLKDITRRRNQLVAANLQLVLSIARRHLTGRPQSGIAALAALLELGNPVLFEAIEIFDPNRNQSFIGFVTYRLQRRFALVTPDHLRAHRRLEAQQLLDSLAVQAQAAGVSLKLE